MKYEDINKPIELLKFMEDNVEYGFWDVIKKHYVDIKGNVLDSPPKYHSIYGLGSYGIITKEVFKALGSDNALESES